MRMSVHEAKAKFSAVLKAAEEGKTLLQAVQNRSKRLGHLIRGLGLRG